MNNGKLFIGLALGAVAGSMLTCFAHSPKGRKLRRDIRHALQDLHEKKCCCTESCCSEEVPQPDEVIEVVAGKTEAVGEKPMA